VTVAGPPRVVGKDGRHLQLTVKQGTSMMKCIAFGHAEATTWLKSGSRIDLAGEPMVSEYMGRRSVEFKVKDLRAAGSADDAPSIRAGAERMTVGE
jgi:single-stranded-DNA-specific exonuclease